MNYRIGVNTIHLKLDELNVYGLNQVEACLGRAGSYTTRLQTMEDALRRAELMQIPYSIHLPLYLPKDYAHDYLDVFFLSPNPMHRKRSMAIVEENLKRLYEKGLRPAYLIQHFSGIDIDAGHRPEQLEQWIYEGLRELNRLAEAYGYRILIEYMGSNQHFHSPDDWVRAIEPFEHIGLLTDTGHLHFACQLYGHDFMESLGILAPKSDAFHLWTIYGPGTYQDCAAYRNYHHIAPHMDQREEDGWAFTTSDVLDVIIPLNKPIIIEASQRYGGSAYYLDAIKSIVRYARILNA